MLAGRVGRPIAWLRSFLSRSRTCCFVALVASAQAGSTLMGTDWRNGPVAPKGAPNIVVILLDDVGFSDPAAFGGVAQMPAFEQVIREGARLTNFNTTGMCSPTRASLLAGRNHHVVGFGRVADWARQSCAVPGRLDRQRAPHGSLDETVSGGFRT